MFGGLPGISNIDFLELGVIKMIRVTMQGSDRVSSMLLKLPGELGKEINRTSEEFLKAVKKSAKIRAPTDTGEMKNTIQVIKFGPKSWQLSVDSPHGIYQELGFSPHWIHSDMIMGTQKLDRTGFFWVKKSTPFVKPALESELTKLSAKLGSATQKAIAKSR
jgi:hypothetical protein